MKQREGEKWAVQTATNPAIGREIVGNRAAEKKAKARNGKQKTQRVKREK